MICNRYNSKENEENIYGQQKDIKITEEMKHGECIQKQKEGCANSSEHDGDAIWELSANLYTYQKE